MQPTAGDIFVVHNGRLDAWVAVQITAIDAGKSPQAAVLTLDWTGKALPTEADVAAMQPARLDFMFWNGRVDHVWVPLPVPPGHRHVGNRPPLVTERVDSYGGGWSDGSLLYAQRRWDARPQASRDRFKAAVKARDERGGAVSLEGVAATRIGNDQLAAIPDLPAFDDMPLLTSIYADRPIPGIFEFLRRREFIYEAALRNHGETHVDLRGARLLRLGIDVTGVKELHLNDELEELTLHGTAAADLRIHAEDDGRWITHYTVDPAFA